MFGRVEGLLLILVVVLVMADGKTLPKLARSIRESVHEFRKGSSGKSKDDVNQSDKTA